MMKTKTIKVSNAAYTKLKWQVESLVEEIKKLKGQVEAQSNFLCNHSVKIYFADNDVAIGMDAKMWHRIVCNYVGDVCEGSPRKHWQSEWSFKQDGFHLESFLDQDWKGWHGQYNPQNELKYDELPRQILMQHHNALVAHIAKLGIWYPCHIYDDINCEVYRP